MDELARIKTALEGMVNAHLQGLIDATSKAPKATPGLLAWIDTACEWELSRRGGKDYELRAPDTSFAPNQDAFNIDAAIMLRSAFALESRSMHAFFDALVALLTGEGRKH